MKNFWQRSICFQSLCMSVALIAMFSLLAVLFPFTRSMTQQALYIGMPFPFLTIYHAGSQIPFTIGLNLPNLLMNLFLGYLLCRFIKRTAAKKCHNG